MDRAVSRRFTVLLYHHVGPARRATPPTLTVAPARFAKQLDWLRRRGYHVLSIDEVVAWATEGRPIPKRSVLITFDDGFADLSDFAFPGLIAAGFTATVFLVTGLLGSRNVWDADKGRDGFRLLDAETVQTWSRRGIEFGVHTRTHPDLSRLSRADAEEEMAGSRRDLEALLDRPAEAFAYPFGATSATACQLAAWLFSVAFLASEEGVNREGTDAHLLRRTMVQSVDELVDIELRARFGFSAHQRARHRLAMTRARLFRPGLG